MGHAEAGTPHDFLRMPLSEGSSTRLASDTSRKGRREKGAGREQCDNNSATTT
jgi:hypothetical protein